MQRGGFPVRSLGFAFFVLGTVYLLYLYNTSLGRLRDAELSAERYRREEETKVAQLQEVMKNKDELQERCDSEKREFTNRLNSLNQQHKMLKSQYDEHEVEQMRLEQEARRVKEEFEQVEAQRNQEYQQLKQEKDLEISNLKDQLADSQRQNEALQTEIATLKTQIQTEEQQLINKNAELQQQQQQQQQHQQQIGGIQNANNVHQLPQDQQGLRFDAHGLQQQGNMVQQQGHQAQQQAQFAQQQHQIGLQDAGFGQQGAVANMNLGNVGEANLGGQGGVQAAAVQGAVDSQQQQQNHAQRVDELNQQHQMVPPNNNNIHAEHADKQGQGEERPAVNQAEVKNEDHQVQPPNLHPDDPRHGDPIHDDAGAALHHDDNNDDNNEEDNEDNQHNDPLGLNQMKAPDMGEEQDGGKAKDADVQQQPPVNDKHEDGNNAAGHQHGVKPAAPQGGF